MKTRKSKDNANILPLNFSSDASLHPPLSTASDDEEWQIILWISCLPVSFKPLVMGTLQQLQNNIKQYWNRLPEETVEFPLMQV